MDKQTVDAITERANNRIVASVWRSGDNLGMAFSRKGKTLTWDEMSKDERVMAVENLYAAADFFIKCLGTPKPDGSHVEELRKKED